MLAGLWAELLGLERVGRHDHFFELGGHSLLAVRLLSRAQNLGMKFSATDLFQTPILREFSQTVKFTPSSYSVGALPVRQSGSQSPIFFVPTGYGDYSYVLPLSKEMEIDCPIYAIPWPIFDDFEQLTIEKISDHVVSVIKNIQPKGPYRLAGYSSGAILAYAISHRFFDINEEVSFLALIDSILPRNPMVMSGAEIITKLMFEPMESIDDVTLDYLDSISTRSSISEILQEAHDIGAINIEQDTHNNALMYVRFHTALQIYAPPSFPIEIHQFYAIENPIGRRTSEKWNKIDDEELSPMRGWDRVSEANSIHTIPINGDHVSMMSDRENRRALAKSISLHLNKSTNNRQNCEND
ncbi:hypothetical protein AWV80_34430 [Cupriavidus sp. UYMU48A]|nr:hypothetical protein AWV80_34430 [Cupriavidus sp. UYMU48A]